MREITEEKLEREQAFFDAQSLLIKVFERNKASFLGTPGQCERAFFLLKNMTPDTFADELWRKREDIGPHNMLIISVTGANNEITSITHGETKQLRELVNVIYPASQYSLDKFLDTGDRKMAAPVLLRVYLVGKAFPARQG